MWVVAKPLLVLLSVALNSAFVAAWLTHTMPGQKCSTQKDGECVLFQKIGVTDAQLKDIEPRLAEFRKCSRMRCQEINRLRRELVDLLAAAEPDHEAIVIKQREILEGQRKMQELVVKQLLTEKSVLTPEQRKAFFDLIRTRCGCEGSEKEVGLLEHMPKKLGGEPVEAPDDCARAPDSGRSSL